MNNVTIIVDLMFATFLIGAMFRVLNYIDLIKKHGVKNVKVTLEKRHEAISDSADEVSGLKGTEFEKADTLMAIMLNIILIFLWCYVHFWMK